MTGSIKSMINVIIDERAHGNPTLLLTTRTKLILKGFNPDRYNETTPDDPLAMEKLSAIAREMGVNLCHY
jgi:hypothetical protein